MDATLSVTLNLPVIYSTFLLVVYTASKIVEQPARCYH